MRNHGNLNPTSWLSRLIYAVTKKRFGKVLAPVKIHGHSPRRLLGMATMLTLQKKPHHIDPRIILLAQVRVGGMVGCAF